MLNFGRVFFFQVSGGVDLLETAMTTNQKHQPSTVTGKQPNNERETHTIHGTGIFTYMWLIFMRHASENTIHGCYGL